MDYGYEKTIANMSFDDAVTKITETLKGEGFGVLTEIDVKATLKKKLDVDFRRYTILGACNPNLAHRALQAEPQVGLLLPCNVVVQEAGEGVTISVVSPPAMFSVVKKEGLEPIVAEADARLRRALEAVG
jgi:uncharacterized protein (DUF302 family)